MNWFGKNRFGWKVAALALLIVSAPVCTAHAEPDITTGLVGHWKLDETSGTTAVDSSGNGNDGTYTDITLPADSATGKLSTAVSFESNQSARVDTASSTDFGGLTAFSYSAWIKPISFSNHMGLFDITSLGRLRFDFNSNNIRFDAPGWDTTIGIDNFDAKITEVDKWYHVVLTYDYGDPIGTDSNLYVDGRLTTVTSGQTPVGSFSAPGTSVFRIGNMDFSGTIRNFHGVIDDARIYNRVLTPEDIAYLYQSFDGNIKYSEDARVPKYFNGESWVAMGASRESLPKGCPIIGDVCDDGSVYAGISSDGDVPMYATPADAGTYAWNDDGTDWTSVPETNLGSGPPNVGRTGELNTQILSLADANSVTAGKQPHEAAQYCYDLVAHGYDDWYLPAAGELSGTLYPNRVAIGGFSASRYWSSNQVIDEQTARSYDFSDASVRNNNKNNDYLVRCVRKVQDYSETALIPTSGLVGYWALDETTGSGVIDYASGNNGTYTDSSGSATTVRNASGVFGGSLDFTDHKVALGLTDDLDFSGTNAFTISAWVKPLDSDSGQHIFQRGDGVVNNGSYLFTRYHLNNTRWRAVIQDGSTYLHALAPVDSVTPGEWALLTTTWDGTNLVIYENGVQIATNSDVGFTVLADNPTPAYQEVSIGGNGRLDDDYFNGSIDDVAVYNRALTPTEISNMYAAGVCANPARINGTIVYNGDGQVMQYCDSLRASGDGWKAMGPAPGDGTGGCSNPTGAEGSLVFNSDYGVMQYCEGDEWISMGKDCPRIGDVCRDGSVYAGLSTDGDIRMFTTPANAGSAMPWNNGNNSGYLSTGQTNINTGEANTNAIVTYDADTGDGGVQPNQAAQHCYDLEAHGKDDWYLPARYELAVLYDNRELIGGFSGGIYWASTDTSGGTFAWTHRFPDGNLNDIQKENNYIVRCVRK
jgi:hypothetical protein